MKIEKKHVIAVGIGVITIAGALAYLQYKKLMDYVIKLTGFKVNKLTNNSADVDLFLTLQNKSSVTYNIESQYYSVSINNKVITTATNNKSQTVRANSSSPVSVNVKFNPESAGANILNSILSLNPVMVKIDVKLKVKVWGFTVSIPYTYESKLADLLIKK